MFKLLLLVAAVAATPVIELQLDQAGLRKAGSTFKSERSANTQWVHHCAAKTSAASADCALPQARAYDHHDGNIAVQSAIYLINDDNKTGMWKKGSVNYNRRSEYIVKYDAADAAGNKADQVIFAIILDDQTAPVFNFNQAYTRECEPSSPLGPPQRRKARHCTLAFYSPFAFAAAASFSSPPSLRSVLTAKAITAARKSKVAIHDVDE